MFNLNENNRFVMSRNPMDLRKGVDSLCGAIRSCVSIRNSACFFVRFKI